MKDLKNFALTLIVSSSISLSILTFALLMYSVEMPPFAPAVLFLAFVFLLLLLMGLILEIYALIKGSKQK